MGVITPVKLLGIGEIWDLTNNVNLSTQAEFSLSSTIETLKIPVGDAFTDSSIPKSQTYKGRFGFRDMNSAIAAAMIAGTSATGAIKAIAKEAQTIPATPFQVTLAQQPYKVAGVTFAPITVVGADGRTYKQVATTPAAAGEFVDTAAAKKLTFHASDTLLDIYVSYYWNDAALGKTVSAAPSVIPGSAAFMFAGSLYSTRTKAFTGYLVAVMKKCQRSGDVTFGATVGDAGTFGFDFDVTVEVPADLTLSFPTE